MPYGMYLSAEGAKVQSKRLEVIANNLANINTVGFKPDTATFQARFTEAIQHGDAMPGSRGAADIGGGVKVIETQTSFAPGRLERTNNDADMAIIGNGFFQVASEEGDALLTRAGSFQLDNVGQLITANGGFPVLDANGGPIQLATDQPWSVTQNGVIEQGGERIPLALVEPGSLEELSKVGNNFFRPRGEVAAVPARAREVRQGYLEMSGANSTSQMMAMIETSRAFEANSRMIQTQDSAMGSLVSRVLRVS